MRSYLIVANQTLTGPQLVNEVLAVARAEPSRFHIVVPATPTAAHTNWTRGRGRTRRPNAGSSRRSSSSAPRGSR